MGCLGARLSALFISEAFISDARVRFTSAISRPTPAGLVQDTIKIQEFDNVIRFCVLPVYKMYGELNFIQQLVKTASPPYTHELILK